MAYGDLVLLIPSDINVCMKWSSASRVHAMIVSLATVWIFQMTFWLFFEVSKYSIFCECHTFFEFDPSFFVGGLLQQQSPGVVMSGICTDVSHGAQRLCSFESETECCAPALLCVSKQFRSPDMIPTWRAHTWHYSDTLQLFPDGRKYTGNCFLQEKDTCTCKSFWWKDTKINWSSNILMHTINLLIQLNTGKLSSGTSITKDT